MIRRSRFKVGDQDVCVGSSVRNLFLLKLACSSRDACMLRLVGDGDEMLGRSCDVSGSRFGRDVLVLFRSFCGTCESSLGRDGLCGRVVMWRSRVVVWDGDV